MNQRRLEQIAAAAGVTPEQAARVLEAAAEPATTPPAPTPAAAASRLVRGTARAAAGVVILSVGVFLFASDAFTNSPDGKPLVLVTSLVFCLLAGRLAKLALRRGFDAGDEVAWASIALVSPLVSWSLLWVLGLWPGYWSTPPASPYYTPQPYWQSGSSASSALAVIVVALAPLALGLHVARSRDSGTAWATSLGALHAIVICLAVLLGIEDLGATVTTMLAGLYFAGLLGLGLLLETSEKRNWASWTHPYAIVGGFSFCAALTQVVPEGVAVLASLVIVVLAAALSFLLQQGLYLIAAATGALILEIWLYNGLIQSPVLALVISLALGLGVIWLAVMTWRQREVALARLPHSLRALAR